MTTGTASQLLHCETSKQLWEEAQSLAGAHTRSRVIYLISEFHNTRKGEKKMEDYLMKMKDLADKLKMAGSPITNADLIIQTLNGLDSDYNPIVVKLSDQINLSWVDLQAQLLAFESRLDQLNSFNNLNRNATTNVANKAQFRGNIYNHRGSWRGSSFRNTRGGRGKGRPSNDICQVCNKHGHTAIECDHRYDKSYTGSSYSNANVKRQRTHNAFLASPYNSQDYEWYFDSGASNHVTHQADKFQELTENSGKNSLIVGNGAKLKIDASGQTDREGSSKRDT
ncbi:unnamed protein product [Trifolium pratense]|uniref:Uncharacterized protein n=1 Tax=Trifolium pratense TaxID=57577 RepID=A0ACB0IV08_TRIPR|nr:unnamed protein product [Trifolium pratense]